jgi:hypothetical protein
MGDDEEGGPPVGPQQEPENISFCFKNAPELGGTL